MNRCHLFFNVTFFLLKKRDGKETCQTCQPELIVETEYWDDGWLLFLPPPPLISKRKQLIFKIRKKEIMGTVKQDQWQTTCQWSLHIYWTTWCQVPTSTVSLLRFVVTTQGKNCSLALSLQLYMLPLVGIRHIRILGGVCFAPVSGKKLSITARIFWEFLYSW